MRSGGTWAGGGEGMGCGHTHLVTPRRPGGAVQVGGLGDESKRQVLKASKKEQRVLVTR